jgi:hypothetical protein
MLALATSLDDPPSGRATPIWIDSLAYSREKLLNGAPVPWASPGELSAFFGKAQGMFRSDALLVDLADLYAEHVKDDDALVAAMTARPRPGFALRTLLGDEAARVVAIDAMNAIGAGDSSTPVVLSVPSPARWLAITAQEPAAAPDGSPEPRHVDAASMYVADFLRIFATARVDGLLLDEGSTPEAALTPVEGYRPVLNVAAHYEWPVWIRTETAPCWPQGEIDGVTGWLGDRVPAGEVGPWGIVLVADPAHTAEPVPETGGGAVLAMVPAAADPDAVMRWVREVT